MIACPVQFHPWYLWRHLLYGSTLKKWQTLQHNPSLCGSTPKLLAFPIVYFKKSWYLHYLFFGLFSFYREFTLLFYIRLLWKHFKDVMLKLYRGNYSSLADWHWCKHNQQQRKRRGNSTSRSQGSFWKCSTNSLRRFDERTSIWKPIELFFRPERHDRFVIFQN